MDDIPAFSRTGTTSPFGKLGDWIERTRIEGVIKEKFVEKATAAGKPYSEAVRDIVRVVALGEAEAARMYGDGVLKVVRMIGGKSDSDR